MNPEFSCLGAGVGKGVRCMPKERSAKLSTYVLISRDIMGFLKQYIIRAVDVSGRERKREGDS